MNVNFELYKVFYEVAIEKSISKGAEKLMISQPAVSQAIQTLENELGGKLFIRTPKGVVLTNEGEILFNYIKEGMNYFINGTNKFSMLKNLEEGVLNIGSTTTISENYLMPYLSVFHDKYPNIDINITNDLTDNLIKSLRNGSLDIVISAIPSEDIKDIKFLELASLHDIFVSGKKFKEIKFNNFEELLSSHIILQKKSSVTRDNFDLFLKKNNFKCNPKMEVVSHGLLTKLAENNFGIALLTKEFISDKLNNNLFEIRTDINIPERKLGYAIKTDVPSFAVSKFIEILNNK